MLLLLLLLARKQGALCWSNWQREAGHKEDRDHLSGGGANIMVHIMLHGMLPMCCEEETAVVIQLQDCRTRELER